MEHLIKPAYYMKCNKFATNLRGMIQFLFNYVNGRMVERGVTHTNTGIKDSHFS